MEMDGIVFGLPAVADPVSEFFRSLRFLLFASRSEDGGKARAVLQRLHARRPGIYASPAVDDVAYAALVGDVCREMVINMARVMLCPAGPIVILHRETGA